MATNSISIDKLIPINDGVINTAAKFMRLIGLFLTDNEQIPTSQRVLNFTSAKQVGDFFGYDSKEYNVALTYFTKYDGSTTTPPSLDFARYINQTTLSQILGSSIKLGLSEIKKINASTFDIVLNGKNYSTGVLDLSTATSFSDVGNKIATALITKNDDLKKIDLKMTFNSNRNNYILTINEVSQKWEFDNTVETELSTALMFTKKTGAYLSNSVDKQTASQNMQTILSFDNNFISFSNLLELSENEKIEICKWVNSLKTNYCYVLSTKDQTVLDINNNDNIVGIVKNAGYKNIILVWGDLDLVAFTMSIGAQIDYTQKNGVLTWAFKSQSGLSYTANTDEEYDVLTVKEVNFYGKFSTKSDTYMFYQAGIITGDYKFIDNYYNQVWLNDVIQNKLAVMFKNAKKIGNGDIGYQKIMSVINVVMSYASNVGVIEKGVTISEDENSEIENILGYSISGELYNNGYYFLTGTPTQENKSDRVAPTSLLFYTNNGAIQKLPITTNFVI